MLAALGVNPQAAPSFQGALTVEGRLVRFAWLERTIAGETFKTSFAYFSESDPMIRDVARNVCRRLRISPTSVGL